MSINPNWPTDPPKKAGMSTMAKVLLWLFGGFVILGLICCGVGGYFFYSRVSTDPKVIAQKSQEIVDMEVPPEFVPTVAVNMLPIMTMVVYEKPPHGTLTIAGFGPTFEGQDKAQLEAQMKGQLKGQGKGGKELQIEEEQTHKFTIHGKESEFVFAKAKDPTSGKEMWQVTGAFEGKGGVSFLLMQVERDDYTEEDLKEIIGSIK